MRSPMDPFGVTCDPRLYVPRLGTEAALAALRQGFAAGRAVCALSGPPGLGKTMVLHVLAARLGPARCVHLPYAALGIEELAHWSLDLLGERAPPERATIALAAAARRDAAAPLVLLVDDASALPVPTARALREIVDALSGTLRIVAAVVDDGRASAVIAALGEDALHVRLRHALTAPEVHEYVRARVERAGPREIATLLRDDQTDWLAAASAGVPRVLNALATWLLRNPGALEAGVAFPDDWTDLAFAIPKPREESEPEPALAALAASPAGGEPSIDDMPTLPSQHPRAPRKRARLGGRYGRRFSAGR